MMKFEIKPIGVVHNGIDEDNKPADWSDVISEIKIYSRYKDGLYKLTIFKKIIVIFWFHKAGKTLMKLHPRGDPNRPIRGVFSTRSQNRPNNIGVTEVELLSKRGNILKVRGLDAFDGTPVIDIKNAD